MMLGSRLDECWILEDLNNAFLRKEGWQHGALLLFRPGFLSSFSTSAV